MRDYARVEVADRAGLRAWLAAHHAGHDPIWLVTAKKRQPGYLSYGEIVEEALCFGWVDSLPRALDAERTMLLLSPRKAGSAWSAPNRERVVRLTTDGLMHPAGLAKVATARADGSWDFLKSAEDGVAPPDLAAALDADPAARRGYEAFSAAVRRRILESLLRARRAETRAARIARILDGARAGVDPLALERKR